jgi:FkbM family methyltransferase
VALTRDLYRLGYGAYARSFLHPHLGGLIKRCLQVSNHFVSREPFVHDVGPFRMHVDLQQLIDTSVYRMGTWEESAIDTIRRFLPAGGVGVDVGANIGFMTMHMACCVGPSGHVLAFEPTTWAHRRLVANLGLNDLPQVEAIRMGLGDAPSLAQGVPAPCGYPLVGERRFTPDDLEIVTLDAYLEGHPIDRLDFVKCDTDGWELHVFRGAAATLRRFRPVILLEVNPEGLAEQHGSVRELVELLRGLGYRLHHEGTLVPFDDLEHAAASVSSHHDLDVVAIHQG